MMNLLFRDQAAVYIGILIFTVKVIPLLVFVSPIPKAE
jgi:hypothetical protein